MSHGTFWLLSSSTTFWTHHGNRVRLTEGNKFSNKHHLAPWQNTSFNSQAARFKISLSPSSHIISLVKIGELRIYESILAGRTVSDPVSPIFMYFSSLPFPSILPIPERNKSCRHDCNYARRANRNYNERRRKSERGSHARSSEKKYVSTIVKRECGSLQKITAGARTFRRRVFRARCSRMRNCRGDA